MNVAYPEALGPLRRALRLRRHGAALLLHGPAGIGKSHAAAALVREVAVASLTLPATLSLAEVAARLPGRGPEGAVTPEALAARLGGAAPLLLVVEDLHEADAAGQAAWTQLAALLPRVRGVALLATSRTPAPTGWPGATVSPLSVGETAALFQGQFGHPAPAGALEWVYGRAAGHPLFTLEYLRFLARSGALYNDGQRWHWRAPGGERVPQSIEALIEAALRAAGADLPLLEARAAEPEADPAAWGTLAGVDEAPLEAGRARLERAGLLHGHAFAHPLYREVLRGLMAPERQRALARRALVVFEGDPRRCAEHLLAADLPEAETLARLLDIADRAEATGDGLLAGRTLARAAALSAGTGEEASLSVRAARLLQQHDLSAARDLALRALRDPDAAVQAAPIATQLSARLGGVAALEACLAALPQAPGLDPTLYRLQALQLIGDHAGVVLQWDAGGPALQGTRDPELLFLVAMCLLAVGRQPEAEALLPRLEGLELTEALRPRLGTLRMMLRFHRGDAAGAAREAEALAALLRAAGEGWRLGVLLHNRAAFLQRAGELALARSVAREAVELRRSLGDRRGHASSLGMLGELAFDAGELPEAEDALTEALDTLELLGPSHFQLNILSMLGRLHAHAGGALSPLLARHFTRRALDMAQVLNNPRLHVETLPDAAHAELAAGDPAAALALMDEALAREAEAGNDPRLRLQHRLLRGQVLAALGRTAEAGDQLREARALAEANGDQADAHRAALETARLDADGAALQRELDWFEAAGHGLAARQARRYLTEQAPAEEPAAGSHQLSVLGPCAVDGRPVRGERRQRLLLALLEARLSGQPEVNTPDLLDGLYPDQSEPAALVALKQLVSQVRRGHGSALILTTARGYALGAVVSDAEAFLASGDTRLWPGPGLPALGSEEVRAALCGRLLEVAAARLDADPAEAARVARLLLQDDPYDHAALALGLRALSGAGNRRSLERLYAQARSQFAELGETLPERWQAYLEGSPREAQWA